MTHLPGTASRAERLARAEELTRRVLNAHGENVLAVGVYGSTGRGSDEPYSDLEMAVVTRERVEPFRHEAYLAGWKFEMEFYTPELLLERAADLDVSWPYWGGQFAQVLALYDPQGYWPALAAQLAAFPEGLFRAALQEAIVGEVLETVAKFRNARLKGNAAMQRWSAWAQAQHALGVVGLANRRFFVSRATAFTEALTFPLRPNGFDDFLNLMEAGDLRNLDALAAHFEALNEGLQQLAADLGLRLEVHALPDFSP